MELRVWSGCLILRLRSPILLLLLVLLFVRLLLLLLLLRRSVIVGIIVRRPGRGRVILPVMRCTQQLASQRNSNQAVRTGKVRYGSIQNRA
jgi:hypothetical protein